MEKSNSQSTDRTLPELPEGWWLYTLRELHHNDEGHQQRALEHLSSAFAAKYMCIAMSGMIVGNEKNNRQRQAVGLGMSPRDAVSQAVEKINERI